MTITADHLDIEPADAEVSDAAIEALARLLVDVALEDESNHHVEAATACVN